MTYVAGLLYSLDWTNTGISFIFLMVNLLRKSAMKELHLVLNVSMSALRTVSVVQFVILKKAVFEKFLKAGVSKSLKQLCQQMVMI